MADAPENTQLWYLQGLLRQNGCKYGQGDDWQCPAHDDDNASLGVSQGEKGVVLHCAAGCHPTEVLAALGTTWPIVFAYEPGDPAFKETPDDAGQARSGQKSLEDQAKAHGGVVKRTAYEYRTPEGDLARKVIRFDFGDGTKTIRQKIHDKRPVLFRYELLRKGIDAGLPVYVVEGEKSVDRLNAVAGKGEQRRAVVTCSPGGSQGWTDGHGALLAGASKVVVIADYDEAGFKYARDVRDSLLGLLPTTAVSVVRSATGNPGDDICEHLDAKFKIRELVPVDLDAELAVDKVDDVPDDEIGLRLPDVIPVERDPDAEPPAMGLAWPSSNQPSDVAEKLAANITWAGHCRIRNWRDQWLYWIPEVGSYVILEEKQMRGQLREILKDKRTKNAEGELVPWNPTSSKLKGVMDMLDGLDDVFVPADYSPGYRFSGEDDDDRLYLQRQVIDLKTYETLPPSPDYFVLSALPWTYDPAASCARWEQFLIEAFDGDAESVALLQEWFGYVLTSDTSHQKFLSLYGPPGSGKSTIARVLRGLLGKHAVESVTIESLGSPFGMAQMARARLCMMSDVSWTMREMDTVVQTLKGVTGEDELRIEDKYEKAYSAYVSARLMLVSNERPFLRDPSGAVMRRLMVLETSATVPSERRSAGLYGELVGEMPGILNWALSGLRRLRERGAFTVPSSTAGELEEIARATTELGTFIEERCELGADLHVSAAEFGDAYRAWREAQAIQFQPNNPQIGRELRSLHRSITGKVMGSARKGTQERHYIGITLRERNLSIGGR
jgi:putative DNA primase/helicase